jgi:hypothetical protein
VRDDGVTFNIMMNLVFADAIVDVPRENPEVLHEVEVASLRDALLEYFTAENEVRIDGEVVAPVMAEFERIEPDLSLLPLFPISGTRGISKVRFALDYPAASTPQQVAMIWAPYPVDVLFSEPGNERLLDIAAELTGEGLKSDIFFTSDEPEYIWHATGLTIEDRFMPVPDPLEPRLWRVPVASLSLLGSMLVVLVGAGLAGAGAMRRLLLLVVVPATIVGAVVLRGVATVEMRHPLDRSGALPNAEDVLSIFRPLHANIYRAFDYTEEEDIYDALARSVHGDLLDDLYNQIYRSLIIYEEGGAVCRVKEVTPVENEVGKIGTIADHDDAIGFQVTARWKVLGVVSHWGHSHSRLHNYPAEYTVIDTADGWRIADNRILEQERINLDEEPGAPVIAPGTEL